jgi:membrane protein implicated in regulation of membrane protease activity
MNDAFAFAAIGLIIILVDIFLTGVFYPLGIGFIFLSMLLYIGVEWTLSVSLSAVFTILLYWVSIKYLSRGKITKGDVSLSMILGLNKTGKVKKKIEEGLYIIDVSGEDWLADSDDKLANGDIVDIGTIGVRLKVRKAA